MLGFRFRTLVAPSPRAATARLQLEAAQPTTGGGEDLRDGLRRRATASGAAASAARYPGRMEEAPGAKSSAVRRRPGGG